MIAHITFSAFSASETYLIGSHIYEGNKNYILHAVRKVVNGLKNSFPDATIKTHVSKTNDETVLKEVDNKIW